jgi:hypothetical protein
MPERRAAKRTKMVLPVKISLEGNIAAIYTVDISPFGARVAGMREEVRPGHTVTLSRGTQKAQFRVVWVQPLDKGEFRAGLEGINLREKFWGVELEKEGTVDNDMEVLMKLLKGPQKRYTFPFFSLEASTWRKIATTLKPPPRRSMSANACFRQLTHWVVLPRRYNRQPALPRFPRLTRTLTVDERTRSAHN